MKTVLLKIPQKSFPVKDNPHYFYLPFCNNFRSGLKKQKSFLDLFKDVWLPANISNSFVKY